MNKSGRKRYYPLRKLAKERIESAIRSCGMMKYKINERVRKEVEGLK